MPNRVIYMPRCAWPMAGRHLDLPMSEPVTGPGAAGEARFSQLQTLWQYSRDRLGESGEADAMRARHGAYYRQMATEAHDGLRGGTGPIWRDRLASESGNLRPRSTGSSATDPLMRRCRFRRA